MDDRKLAVLRAIVDDYVETREPVGSKSLADRHSLGVSSATIRNDMAALEDEGLISAPHTSAGRIPTDKGYRVFVDRLSSVKPLSQAERRAIHTFLDQAVDLDDVMNRTVRLLAQLTKQVALVQYPSLGRSSVRHIEIVPITSNRLFVILIADTGRIEQRTVDIGMDYTDEFVADLRTRLNTATSGQLLSDVPSRISNLAEQFAVPLRRAVSAVVATLLESVVTHNDERVVVGGTSNLARVTEDFTVHVGPVLEALEEHVVLLRLLGESSAPDSPMVRIGSENSVEELRGASVVSVGYGSGETAIAHLGILGPTRMDYAGSISAVSAVARYVGHILMEQ
ncbi:MAG: heat-inducible transcriptional repressor HrcA [Actinomycetes bacterium]